MEKEKEKIQELVNKMAANLLEQGIILSEAVKKQVCEDLCKDASSSIRAEQRTLVKREVGLLFSGLEKHFTCKSEVLFFVFGILDSFSGICLKRRFGRLDFKNILKTAI